VVSASLRGGKWRGMEARGLANLLARAARFFFLTSGVGAGYSVFTIFF
jgi:hypothetical protein